MTTIPASTRLLPRDQVHAGTRVTTHAHASDRPDLGHPGCTGHGGSIQMAKKAATRELINTGSDKRYVRRNASGQFKESDDVGRSLTQDRRQNAERKTVKGQGDRGDR